MQRTVYLTGAGAGLGRELLGVLAGRGAAVVPFVETAAQADQLRSAAGGSERWSKPIVLDLADPSAVEPAVVSARRDTGPASAVIHCAGATYLGPLAGMTADELARIIAVNLAAPLELLRCTIGDLSSSRDGRVILLGSAATLITTGPSLMTAYVASKSGLRAASIDINKELHDIGVRSTIVTLGTTRTGMYDSLVRGAAITAEDSKYVRPARLMQSILAPADGAGLDSSEAAGAIADILLLDEPPLECYLPEVASPVLLLEHADDRTRRSIFGANSIDEIGAAAQAYFETATSSLD